MKQTNQINFTFAVDKWLKNAVKAKCRADDRTVAGQLRLFMKAYIEGRIEIHD